MECFVTRACCIVSADGMPDPTCEANLCDPEMGLVAAVLLAGVLLGKFGRNAQDQFWTMKLARPTTEA
jgi:hypothetical protein